MRVKHVLLLSVALVGVVSLALSSCGGKGGGGGGSSGPPFISAELNSFPPGAAPAGYTTNAFVAVLDADDNSIAGAAVTMNAVALAYNAANGDYEGVVAVPPGGAVNLSVTVAGASYTASAAQFGSYPTLSAPAPGDTWDASVQNTLTFSGGGATGTAKNVLGILDAGDPNGALQWPATHFLQVIPQGTMSLPFPALDIPAGNRLLIAGISADTAIPAAAPGSVLTVQGFSYVPITVTGFPLTVHSSGTASVLQAVAWSGTQFVAVGFDIFGFARSPTNGINGKIFTSPDGLTWTSRLSLASAALNAVTWSGTQFVAVGRAGILPGPAPILTSSDGISWTSRTSGVTSSLTGVAWSGTKSLFVAVGANPATILSSPDGFAWTPHAPGVTNGLSAVTSSGTQFVAVGDEILTSPDGTTWTPHSSGTSNFLDGITWSGTQFVAVGRFPGDAIVTSPDGVTWTPRSSPTIASPVAVAWSGTQFVAVGIGGTVITSTDGATWTQASGAYDALLGVVWSGTKFVVVGGSRIGAIGTVLTSP